VVVGQRRDVAFWHKCEVATALSKVRFQGQPGRHLLALNSSQFEPRVDLRPKAQIAQIARGFV
jgi:hypothetical protein